VTSLTNPPTTDFDSPEHQARLAELYRDFDAVGMTPLWRTRTPGGTRAVCVAEKSA
jgi:gentisate 1,2-dioxygenase